MKKFTIIISSVLIFALLIPVISIPSASAELPDWIKNTARWYGEGKVTENDFLNAIQFLIDKGIIKIESTDKISTGYDKTSLVVLPNGNYEKTNRGFYIPLNAVVDRNTAVIWTNQDTVGHTIQSMDDDGNIISLFNSGMLETGDQFKHKFTDSGKFNYFCTIHPWRIGTITVL